MEGKTSSGIEVVLGTMTFGMSLNEEQSHEMLDRFLHYIPGADESSPAKTRELDTAYMYEDGTSETYIGSYLHKQPDYGASAYIATKVNAFPFSGKSLSADSVKQQFTTSLARLNRSSVDLLYLHAPDPKTPIEQTLAVVNEFYRAGMFKEFGLSNYSAFQVVEICQLCDAHNWIRPTAYQGMYNVFTRSIEELIPVLRTEKIRLYIYNPLAGGLLTGRYNNESADQQPKQDGRFNAPGKKKAYQDRYWKACNFEAIKAIQAAIDADNQNTTAESNKPLTMTDVAFRWLLYHSQLQAGDRVIIGASSLKHMEDNLAIWKKESEGDVQGLSASLVKTCEDAWELCKKECQPYHR